MGTRRIHKVAKSSYIVSSSLPFLLSLLSFPYFLSSLLSVLEIELRAPHCCASQGLSYHPSFLILPFLVKMALALFQIPAAKAVAAVCLTLSSISWRAKEPTATSSDSQAVMVDALQIEVRVSRGI